MLRNKLTESEAMAVAITRHAALRSRVATPAVSDSCTNVLELAKLDVAKQKHKAQVVYRNNSLSKAKCVKPVKPRGGSMSCTGNGAKLHAKSLQANSRVRVVAPRLPWNIVNIPSRTDSGLTKASQKIVKSTSPRPREPKNASAEGHNPTKLVVRRTKSKSANMVELDQAKRRSRSLESLLENSEKYSPTQCFRCRKDLSMVQDSSMSSRFSDTCSSMSDIGCSLEMDMNGNYLPQSKFVNTSPKPFGMEHSPVLRGITSTQSDTECYRHQYESDSQLETASDTEFYRCKSRLKDKRHLYLDSPIPVLLKARKSGSANSIKERKIQLEQDLDSLLDSMEYVLKKPKQTEEGAESSDSQYSPPVFFRPIFEVNI